MAATAANKSVYYDIYDEYTNREVNNILSIP